MRENEGWGGKIRENEENWGKMGDNEEKLRKNEEGGKMRKIEILYLAWSS